MSAHEALRRALEPFHTLVQECVVQRLLHGRSHAELAATLEMPQDQVKRILDRMRPWVTKFVGYFSDDRFWSEGPMPGQDGAAG
uniref:Sigma-70 family RNA polymerase sigma factor n=1 Tax=candidate division WOR-3 bacterium TaxID=2052148 RepID=A0A7C4CC59_UNCW3